ARSTGAAAGDWLPVYGGDDIVRFQAGLLRRAAGHDEADPQPLGVASREHAEIGGYDGRGGFTAFEAGIGEHLIERHLVGAAGERVVERGQILAGDSVDGVADRIFRVARAFAFAALYVERAHHVVQALLAAA